MSDQSLDQFFRSARTPNGWADRPVEDETVPEMYDFLKWGPTSANSSPARFVWVRSADGKATLAGLAAEPNKPKILKAPATVIIGPRSDPRNGEIFMSTQENVQIVKDFFAAMVRGDKQGLLALVAEDIEWIIPGKDWPLAGTHRGHAGLAEVLQKASVEVEMTYSRPPEFVAQADRVLVIGVATGKIKATNRAFRDDWVFAITVQNGKVTKIREYIDTQALAQASQMDASGLA